MPVVQPVLETVTNTYIYIYIIRETDRHTDTQIDTQRAWLYGVHRTLRDDSSFAWQSPLTIK